VVEGGNRIQELRGNTLAEIIKLDEKYFFDLLYPMLREDGSEEEIERTNAIMFWATEKQPMIERVTIRHERKLLMLVWKHWSSYKSAPSRQTLGDMAAKQDKPESLLEMLNLLDEYVAHLTPCDAYAMDERLQRRIDDWDKVKMADLLGESMAILIGSQPNPDKRLPPLSGKGDAMTTLLAGVQAGLFVDSVRVRGGNVGDTAMEIMDIYRQNAWEAQNGSLLLKTCLGPIDQVIGGFKRKEMVTILGYAGQRKSTVCRTLAYNMAALQGFRVLYIPLESSYDEERTFQALIHAHAQKKTFGELGISKTAFDNGVLKPEDEAILESTVLPHMQALLRDRLVVRELDRRTWADICNAIEMENRVEPLDAVVVDYLALADSTERDPVACINATFKQAKQLSLTFDGGRGLLFMTPVQGSRDGYKKAGENDGVWEATGIYMYSEAEKSSDTCVYVFADDGMKSLHQMKMGTCKSRRSGDVTAHLVQVHPLCGYVGNFDHTLATQRSLNTPLTNLKDPY
jgi:hypothetical protein